MKRQKREERMTKKVWNESVKSRIMLYLVNYRRNKEQLVGRPYFIFEDLAVVFRFSDPKEPLKEKPVDHKDLNRWGIQKEELYRYAMENMRERFPAHVKTAVRNLKGLDQEPVFIVSNRQGIYGAGVMLYPGFLKELSGRYGWSLFLMPWSVHEVFILLDRGQFRPDHLRKMMQKNVSGLISEQDCLSDNLYYYDSFEKQILTLY